MNLNALAKTSYEIAKEKGWWDNPRDFDALSLLMVSEISEALEDYRANKPLNQMHYEEVRQFSEEARKRCGLHMYHEADGICECYVTHKKPCGIPSEIADFVIRVADYAWHIKFNLNKALKEARETRKPEPKYNSANFENALTYATYRTMQAFGAWCRDEDTVPVDLAWALQPIFETCEVHKIDLEKAIEEKTAFNRTRPFKHGGKKI